MDINLTQAATEICSGGIIAYPTESIFGLGCSPFNEQAFNKLLTLKNREPSKGVIVIAASLEQIAPMIKIKNQPWEQQVIASWQNNLQAITWVLPATDKTPEWLTGGRKTLAVRITHHPEIIKLCNKIDSPIVSTSANISQQPPAKTREQCLKMFPKTAVLEGETLGQKQPSQIWDARSAKQLR